MGSGSRSAGIRQLPPLDEDCTYLVGICRPVFEEEMGKVARYSRHALTIMALDTSDHSDAFLFDWHHIEKQRMKDKDLSIVRRSQEAAHKEMEFLQSQNVLLARRLVECTRFTLEEVLQSFKNALDQVEYFYHPLKLSMEEIQPDQAIMDGNIIFLRK
ncbi:unnamed protein product [Vicia faba]|uniref:Uncharacterized protein n=1 Tax=Vicia faba TaxID=3906 RepID=A0AAV0ZF72_VICFA|nr:unnamed protein product [Vicia faba]